MSYRSVYPPSGAASFIADAPLNLSGSTLTIPKADATADGYLSAADYIIFSTAAGGGISGLSGDVTTGIAVAGVAPATVALVGGSTAANVHAAELLANAATSANTASAIVKRDGSGNFVAGAVTLGAAASQLALGSTFKTTISSAVTAARTLNLPDANSVTVQPTTATSNQWVTNIDSTGLQTKAQPAFSNISGSVNLATQVTDILDETNGGTGLNALGGAQSLLGVNAGGTALDYKTLASAGGTVAITYTVGGINLETAGGGGGVTGVGTFDSQTPDAKGLVISGASLYAQSATASVPGMLNTSTQTIAGAKTLTSALTVTAASNQLVLGSTNTTTYTSAALSGNRVFTTPNANSNSVQPLGSGTANQWVKYIDSNGLQNTTQPDFTEISGDVNLATQVTGILDAVNGGTGLNALGGANSFLAMNSGGTALGYKTFASAGGTVAITYPGGNINLETTGGGGGVPSITGTANQILVNGTSGSAISVASTLTLPANVGVTKLGLGDTNFNTTLSVVGNAAIGFTAGATAQTNGLSINGVLNLGAVGTDAAQLVMTGTRVVNRGSIYCNQALSNNTTASPIQAFYFAPTVTNGATGSTHYGLYSRPEFTNTSFTSTNIFGHWMESVGTGTATTFTNVRMAAPTSGTSRYNLVVEAVSGGTNNICGQFLGGVQMGYSLGTVPPTNGLVVSGKCGFNTSSPSSVSFLNFNSSTGQSAGISTYYTGNLDGNLFSNQSTSWYTVTHSLAFNANIAATIVCNEIFAPSSGTTTSNLAGIYINNTYSSNAGTITLATAILADSGSGGTGTITECINIVSRQPTAGVSNYSMWVDGGLVLKTTQVFGNYTALLSDHIIEQGTTSSPFTITLPSAAPKTGWTLVIKDGTGGAGVNNITINGNGRNINGAVTTTINTNYGFVRIYFRGTQYYTM